MQDISLQQAMNRVSSGLEQAGLASPETAQPLREEIDVFAQYDPLLADLQKQYLDARAVRKRQLESFGAEDPMAEIAADMEDSAWCAMQTRYIELRDERLLMARVQKEMRAERRERAPFSTGETKKSASLFSAGRNFQAYQRQRAKKKAGSRKFSFGVYSSLVRADDGFGLSHEQFQGLGFVSSLYQVVHDIRFGECGCVSQIFVFIRGDFAQNPAHDFP